MIIEVDLYETEKLKEAILGLPFNDKIDSYGVKTDVVFIPRSDYGFAEIYRMYDDILVFIIPEYGGTPCLAFHVGRHAVDYLISKLQDIT